MLQQYECVVWLDADTSVQASLDEVVSYAPFGITSDAPWPVQNNFTEPIAGFEMQIPGACTAVMVAKDTLPYGEIGAWCYRKALEYSHCVINADQGIINLMLQEFGIIPNLMPVEKWQCISWRDEANIANLVHFGTGKKVWNNDNLCNAFPEWYRVHLEWLKLGGSDFQRMGLRPRNVLKQLNVTNSHR